MSVAFPLPYLCSSLTIHLDVQHGTLSGTLHVIKNVGVMGRKGVTLKPGSITQLGGEFVFGPGLACTYAHRMPTTRSHASIKIPLAHAGVVFDGKPSPATKLSSAAVGRAPSGRRTGATSLNIDLAPGEVQSWRLERGLELERMRSWRESRRRGRYSASGKKRDIILEDGEEKEAEEVEAEGWTRARAEQKALRAKEQVEEQAKALAQEKDVAVAFTVLVPEFNAPPTMGRRSSTTSIRSVSRSETDRRRNFSLPLERTSPTGSTAGSQLQQSSEEKRRDQDFEVCSTDSSEGRRPSTHSHGELLKGLALLGEVVPVKCR